MGLCITLKDCCKKYLIINITTATFFFSISGTLGRFVMFLVFLAFLFIYTSYSANIVALLQSTSNQIRTLTDLLNSKLELGVEDVAYNKYYFSVILVTLYLFIKSRGKLCLKMNSASSLLTPRVTLL